MARAVVLLALLAATCWCSSAYTGWPESVTQPLETAQATAHRQLRQTCTSGTCDSTIAITFKGGCARIDSTTSSAILSALQQDVAASVNSVSGCTSSTVTAAAVGGCQPQGSYYRYQASVTVTATATCASRVQSKFTTFCSGLATTPRATLCSSTLKKTCSVLSSKALTLQSASGTPPTAVNPNPSAPPPAPGNCSVQQHLAVPSYIYPLANDGSRDANWQRLYSTPAATLVLINPSSGPGTAADPSYAQVTTDFRALGRRVLGYVYTGYGTRDVNAVIADINQYYSWYNISGIFLDEGSTNCTTVAHYQSLVAAVKTKDLKSTVVLNWGINGPECFLNATSNTVDIVINFEDTYPNYQTWSGPGAWVSKYPAARFWHLVHTTPADGTSFASAVTLAKSRHAAWVYVTNDGGSNPWDTVPTDSLWSREVAEVTSNSTCVA